MQPKAVIISGPTASGKSGLALDMAGNREITIINADSLQIYQGLPILSSQPSQAEQAGVTHYLYSHLKPHERSSVGLWLQLVESAMKQSWQDNKLPVIVGGTGMYITKLVEGISKIPDIDEDIKKGARPLFEEMGADAFVKELVALGDQEEKVMQLDKQRLIRAYEVMKQTGKSIFWWQSQPKEKLFDDDIFTHVNLNPDRQKLYEQCNLRFEMMLDHGAIDEVKGLLEDGFLWDESITKTLGFVEIVDFLEGNISRDDVIARGSQKTRNYAKRQLTWFRHQLSDKKVFDDKARALDFLMKM